MNAKLVVTAPDLDEIGLEYNGLGTAPLDIDIDIVFGFQSLNIFSNPRIA